MPPVYALMEGSEIHMTLSGTIALFWAMLVLSALPSVSVLTVLARSAAGGFSHGSATTLGILAGDLVYIFIALFGLALLTSTIGGAADYIRYAAALYLVWFAITLWRSTERAATIQSADADPSLLSSFMAGLLLTLADQKVVIFYLGFLPAFLDLAAVSKADIAGVVIVTVLAVGSVKFTYAALGQKAANAFGARARCLLQRTASASMLAAAIHLCLGK